MVAVRKNSAMVRVARIEASEGREVDGLCVDLHPAGPDRVGLPAAEMGGPTHLHYPDGEANSVAVGVLIIAQEHHAVRHVLR